jgi:hypothetical protein
LEGLEDGLDLYAEVGHGMNEKFCDLEFMTKICRQIVHAGKSEALFAEVS